MALPPMDQRSSMHIPLPADPGGMPTYIRWFDFKAGPAAQTGAEEQKESWVCSRQTSVLGCSSHQLGEFGLVISPLFLHFLISKMGMRA